MQSSSGGGATAISRAIIKEGGIVFGACYSSDYKAAEFACIEREQDLYRLKTSKYIETDKKVFHDGEYKSLWQLTGDKLQSGHEVLFTGLGCDVAALKSFLNANKIDASKLFTIDLFCYGPTLKEVHRQYVSSLERKYNSCVVNFSVRYKKQGWVPSYIMAEFQNGRKFYELFYNTDYGKAFAMYARRACYSCNFRGVNHNSDITVGDFWGINENMSGYNPNGVSIFIVHNQRGEELLRKIDGHEFTLQPADVEFAIENNKVIS